MPKSSVAIAGSRQINCSSVVSGFMPVVNMATPVCRSTSPACAKPLRRRQGAQAQGTSLTNMVKKVPLL